MLILFYNSGRSRRSVTDTPPLQRAVEIHGKNKDIECIEAYKYNSTLRDYKYICTIKFDKVLLSEFE